MQDKRIEVIQLPVGQLKKGFGNPRKIKKKKREELENSIDSFGDFGVFVIDEDYNIICGNQRWSVIYEKDPETIVTCKRLIGYSEAELKAINIKDNTHAGEWDLDLLAEWTADLTVDLGLDLQEQDPEDRKLKEMEPVRYEKYDYVIIACNNEIDYNRLVRDLGIEGKKVKVSDKGRTIKARAVWYQDIKAQIVPKEGY